MTGKDPKDGGRTKLGRTTAAPDWPLPDDYPNIVTFDEVLGDSAAPASPETTSADDASEAPPAEEGSSSPP